MDLRQLGSDLRDERVLLDELGQVHVHAWIRAHLEWLAPAVPPGSGKGTQSPTRVPACRSALRM